MKKPQPFERYRHFKGNLYQVLALAEHSETGEELVIYQALYGDYRVYARPVTMFLGLVDKEAYKDAQQEYRFEAVGAEQIQPEGGQDMKQEGGQDPKPKEVVQQADEAEEVEIIPDEYSLDPMVVQFLDADTYEEKLNLLTGLHHRITNDMINVMAMASDVEIPEGEIEDRFAELKNCLLKFEKFEGSRIR